jgi:hypothetical protein
MQHLISPLVQDKRYLCWQKIPTSWQTMVCGLHYCGAKSFKEEAGRPDGVRKWNRHAGEEQWEGAPTSVAK